MTHYIVHLYREMRLSYTGIEAETPQAAAALTRDKPTAEADNIEDCDGETLSALVDVAGDEEFEHSRFIDFEHEKQHKAAGIPSGEQTATPPSRFEIEHDLLENPDRAHVLVDNKFDVAISRTEEGLIVDVYPKDWIDPIDSLTVWDQEVAEASAQAETTPHTEA